MDNDTILLVFRGDVVIFKKSEIINLTKEDWFLSNILQMDFDDKTKPEKLEICEDKNTAMSLIETMRYNSLVVYPNVSLDYLLALADKWCLPVFIIKMIQDRIINNININRMSDNLKTLNFDEVDTKITFKCINCKGGFKVSENTSESCAFHPKDINYNMDIRQCCGKPRNSQPCRKCHHVMSVFDLRVYFEMKKELKIINKT